MGVCHRFVDAVIVAVDLHVVAYRYIFSVWCFGVFGVLSTFKSVHCTG